jgi:cell shape-determining protein MreC
VTGPAGETTFVSGIDVGTVYSVTRSADGTVRVSIRPAAGQTGLDLLGIVTVHSRTAPRPTIGPNQ